MTDVKQLPEAFLKEMEQLLGDEYEAYIKSYEEAWKPGLRVNTLKIMPEEFKNLSHLELTPVDWTEKGFYYEDTERPARHPFYYAGLYYLQEPSAMAPAAVLPVEPGDKVLDVCAAPGGKSTELAAKLQGKGMLVSNDISYSRARALLKNLELAGAENISVLSEEPGKLAAVWPEFLIRFSRCTMFRGRNVSQGRGYGKGLGKQRPLLLQLNPEGDLRAGCGHVKTRRNDALFYLYLLKKKKMRKMWRIF